MKLLRFTASWCKPCAVLAKNLEEANLGIPIEVIDIDVYSDLPVEYNVRGVPSLILLDGEKEVKRITGSRSVGELREWINEKA